MLTCKETSELVSQSIERRLAWREGWAVRLHLLICTACSRFRRQVEFLHAAARQYARREPPTAQQLRLRPDARARIQHALERNEGRD